MYEIEYEVVDESKKIIKLTYMNESATFKLVSKRAFTVLCELAKRHPELMNIHDLDGIYNDPNRALSDLRNTDGFEPFIIIDYQEKGVIHAGLNIHRLFSSINKKTEIIELSPQYRRSNISNKDKREIFDKFNGKCNITGVKLRFEDNFEYSDVFLKTSQIAAYDHRKPLVKTGNNDSHNWQLVSSLVNQEKNKICNACIDAKCDTCALAHPERVSVIHPTGQNISNLRRNGNGH